MHYSASEMYALVNDIAAYPEFLPWCRAATVHTHSACEVQARIELAKAGFCTSFTTANRLEPNHRIKMRLVQGPFRRLYGCWLFSALRKDACRVSLELHVDISGAVLSRAFGSIFHEIADTIVDAFCRRAAEIYGRR